MHLYVFDEIKKAKSVLLQSEINKTNADSNLILESVRHYFNLIRSQALVEVGEAENEFHRSMLTSAKKLFQNGSMSVEDYQTIRNDYEMSINDLTISKNQLLEIKNDVYVFSGKRT